MSSEQAETAPPKPDRGESVELFDYGQLRDYAGFMLRSPGRHGFLAVASFLVVVGLAGAASMLLPDAYQSRATILARAPVARSRRPPRRDRLPAARPQLLENASDPEGHTGWRQRWRRGHRIGPPPRRGPRRTAWTSSRPLGRRRARSACDWPASPTVAAARGCFRPNGRLRARRSRGPDPPPCVSAMRKVGTLLSLRRRATGVHPSSQELRRCNRSSRRRPGLAERLGGGTGLT